MSRSIVRLALVPLFFSTGCDSLSANSFAGTIVEMTLSGVTPNGADDHFELWSRDANDDIIRVNGIFDVVDPVTKKQLHAFNGFTVRPAVLMGDQCMIDGKGNLLVSAAAYPTPVTFNGVPQSPEEQAAQVRTRIGQLTTSSICDGSGGNPSSHCGRETATLLGLVPWNPIPPPAAFSALTFNSSAADRLAACTEYWQNPLAYTPNPAQLTAPLHGTIWGFLSYTTLNPPGNFDGIRIDSPVNLAGIQELWITTETLPAGMAPGTDFVDPKNRGPVYVQGTPDPGGNEVVHFDLAAPFGATGGASGTAALEVNLDQDNVQF